MLKALAQSSSVEHVKLLLLQQYSSNPNVIPTFSYLTR